MRGKLMADIKGEASKHAQDMQAVYYKSIFDAMNEQIV
jgi:hypothetical protein